MANPKGNPATLTEKYAPKWKHGKTRTIRVPIALADEILEYAHQLDEQSLTQALRPDNNKVEPTSTQDQDTKLREALRQVIVVLEKVCETPHTSKFTKVIKAQLITYAINPLKTLTQPNQSVE